MLKERKEEFFWLLALLLISEYLEFSNTTTLPAKIYAHEGVAQMLFLEATEVCAVSYRDRGGKYQGQQGVTLPKI